MLALLLSLPSWAEEPGRISAIEAEAMRHRGALTIVDVRRAEEWRATGVATGARRATILSPDGRRGFLADIESITGGDKSMAVGLICAAGNRSRHAARLLRQEGYLNVFDIGEGMLGNAEGAGWLARGLPTEPCPSC